MAVEAELSGRKKKILKAVVELYVKTAEPVGSKAIASALDNRRAIWKSRTLLPGASLRRSATGFTSTN